MIVKKVFLNSIFDLFLQFSHFAAQKHAKQPKIYFTRWRKLAVKFFKSNLFWLQLQYSFEFS